MGVSEVSAGARDVADEVALEDAAAAPGAAAACGGDAYACNAGGAGVQ